MVIHLPWDFYLDSFNMDILIFQVQLGPSQLLTPYLFQWLCCLILHSNLETYWRWTSVITVARCSDRRTTSDVTSGYIPERNLSSVMFVAWHLHNESPCLVIWEIYIKFIVVQGWLERSPIDQVIWSFNGKTTTSGTGKKALTFKKMKGV